MRVRQFGMKLIAFVLVFTLVLAGCSSNSQQSTGANQNTNTTSNQNTNKANNESATENTPINYPTKGIDILVGHGAGGGTDNFARAIALELKEILGVNINVINQEGGGGIVAKQNGASAPADGYTVVASSAFAYTTASGTNKNDLSVYIPIARVQSDTYALQVQPGLYKDIEEFIQAAKEKPGEIRIGGVGSGMDEITVMRLHDEIGIEVNYVPMQGAGQMHAAVLGGHIEAMVEEIGPTQSLISDGSLKPLMFLAKERLSEFPDVPTSVELGWNLTDGVERGFIIRRDVDPQIIEILEEAIKKAKDTERYKEYEKNSFLHLRDGWLGSKEYEEKLGNDIDKFKEILERIGSK